MPSCPLHRHIFCDLITCFFILGYLYTARQIGGLAGDIFYDIKIKTFAFDTNLTTKYTISTNSIYNKKLHIVLALNWLILTYTSILL